MPEEFSKELEREEFGKIMKELYTAMKEGIHCIEVYVDETRNVETCSKRKHIRVKVREVQTLQTFSLPPSTHSIAEPELRGWERLKAACKYLFGRKE